MDEPTVIRCPPSQRAAALRLLHAAVTPGQQDSLAETVAALANEAGAWDGLLVVGAQRPTAALWVQRTPGNTAVVWPPPPDWVLSDALFRAAAAFVDERRIAVAQLNVAQDAGFSPQRIGACGFAKLAELLYLFADLAQASHGSPTAAHFQPHAGNNAELLARVVESTYVGTRDCPALDGVRPMSDVLEGYRAQGRHMPEHWYTVHESAGGEPVGALILADHPAAGSWELVYMGVTPEARGRRLGDRIVQFAQKTAAQGGAERMVLAVDAANRPALDLYRRTGFFEWERRTVYARLAAPRAAE